jgi:peptidoglycan/xylan/chitin deacetylase (PgdA/CDA1 family)
MYLGEKMLKQKITLIILILLLLVFGISYNTTKPTFKSTNKDEIQLPILMYHKINPSSTVGGLGLRVLPGEFDWQMGYLYKNGYQTLTMEEGYQYLKGSLKIKGKPIIITFDDGYKDNYTYAYPILKKYNYTGNIFLISNIIGKTNVWDEKAGKPTNYIMNWDEIDEMRRAGIYFGAHTANHPKLAQVSKETAWQEIKESKDDLEAHFKEKVDYFCYPFGSYNKDVEDLVQKAGFKAAITVDQGINKPNPDFYALKRIRIMGSFSKEHFVELLNTY